MGLAQTILVFLFLLELFLSLLMNGAEDRVSFLNTFISEAVLMFLLVQGGFFG